MSNTAIKVLQFSTHNEDCGIGKYQEQYVVGMTKAEDFYTEYFYLSPNVTKYMPEAEFAQVVDKMSEQMRNFDILHIQHELSFFKHDELQKIIERIATKDGKKVMVTVHTAPDVQLSETQLGGLGPRSLLHFARHTISQKRYLKRYFLPLLKADLIIVHNEVTKTSLMRLGLSDSRIKVFRIPVSSLSFELESNEIKKQLHYKKDDIIFSTVGFMSASKGLLQAVKALTFLPDNYKLAIIGGMHPETEDTSFYDVLTDQIKADKLQERVYFTGYIEDDARLHTLIRETDICVYPYDKKYYSFVSSASLNTAIANYKPIIAYATPSFVEINVEMPVVKFTSSPNYYELARSIVELDIEHGIKMSKDYAALYDWNKEALKFVDIYRSLLLV